MLHGVGLVDPELIPEFFNNYHEKLLLMGVDGVKVDAQSILSSLSGERGGGYMLTSKYHRALKQSVGNYFGNNFGNKNNFS